MSVLVLAPYDGRSMISPIDPERLHDLDIEIQETFTVIIPGSFGTPIVLIVTGAGTQSQWQTA